MKDVIKKGHVAENALEMFTNHKLTYEDVMKIDEHMRMCAYCLEKRGLAVLQKAQEHGFFKNA